MGREREKERERKWRRAFGLNYRFSTHFKVVKLNNVLIIFHYLPNV